jgi:hypothetical protein
MRKKIIFLACLLFSLLLATWVFADTQKVKVKVPQAKLRVKPTLEATVMGKIPQGTVLTVIAKLGIWYQVELQSDSSGIIITGYILQDEVTEETTETVTQVPPSFPPPPPPAPSTARKDSEVQRAASYPAAVIKKGRFYASGLIGMGFGFDRIKVGEVKYTDGDWEDIIIMPGGGLNAEARLGFYFTSSLRAELGASYQASGNTYKVYGSDNEFILSFKRIPLNLTLLYDLPTRGSMQIYIGAGPTVSVGPSYTEEFVSKDSIDYEPSFGFHALVGFLWNKGKWFYFGEVCYMGPFTYSWTSASFIPPTFMRELSGNGIFINFGGGIWFGR